ncbi:unnamed protein product [Parnassius mnemosyne]|uniref:THAP-type domain-containing protein n=1 Tax=Parnassius mnemosyne TaxID=213953 RepID=A0AAV1K8R1_9NEOP
MPFGAVLEYRNNSKNINVLNGGVSYHRFPKDGSIKESWVKATGRQNWLPFKSSSICSEHFTESDFLISKRGYHYLKTSSVPTKKILSYIEPTNKARILNDNNINEEKVKSKYLKDIGCKVIEDIAKNFEPVAENFVETKVVLPNKTSDRNQQNGNYMFSQIPDSKMLNEQDCVAPETHPIVKTVGVNEGVGSSTFSTPRKQKLRCMLRWSEEKVKKQNLNIK